MRPAALPRRAAALAAAAVLHALLAAWLVVQLTPPPVAEVPAMQVTLLTLPPRAAPPVRASRPPADAPSRGPRAPAPGAAPSPIAAPAADWRVRPAEAEGAQTARAALRARLGCRTADLLALTKAERAACEDALAKDARNAPAYAVISPKLKKVFDRTFECPKGDVWCEYRMGKAPYPGLFTPMRKPRDPSWDQAPPP